MFFFGTLIELSTRELILGYTHFQNLHSLTAAYGTCQYQQHRMQKLSVAVNGRKASLTLYLGAELKWVFSFTLLL